MAGLGVGVAGFLIMRGIGRTLRWRAMKAWSSAAARVMARM